MEDNKLISSQSAVKERQQSKGSHCNKYSKIKGLPSTLFRGVFIRHVSEPKPPVKEQSWSSRISRFLIGREQTSEPFQVEPVRKGQREKVDVSQMYTKQAATAALACSGHLRDPAVVSSQWRLKQSSPAAIKCGYAQPIIQLETRTLETWGRHSTNDTLAIVLDNSSEIFQEIIR